MISKKNKLITLSLKVNQIEYLRFLVLFILVAYLYSPFITSFNLGNGDAEWYHYILHDAIIQFRHGIFPVYVGQSVFSSLGTPVIRGPYYILLGQFLDLITFRQLSALVIQHLTILFSVFSGAFVSYFLMVRLAPTLRWYALALAFFYVSCPGVIGIIRAMDMYNSCMVLPYLPVVIYGLIRTHQKDDIFSYIMTAAALSILYMAHPPIALWTTIVCMFFYALRFFFSGPSKRKFLLPFLVPVLLIILNLWHFCSTVSLGLATEYYGGVDLNYADHVIPTLKAEIPGVFLPLGLGVGPMVYLQLGYSLWLLIFLGLIISIRSSNQFTTRSLLACFALLLLFLYPFPFITHMLWSLVPQAIDNITMHFPMQRFYCILAILACFIGILTLRKNRIFSICLLLLSIWNIYQASYFIQLGLPSSNKTKTLLSSEVVFSYYQQVENTFMGVFPEGNYDPLLKNKLLDKKQLPIESFDDEKILLKKCFADEIEKQQTIKLLIPNLEKFIFNNNSAPTPFLQLNTLAHKKYLLCLKFKSIDLTEGSLQIIGSNRTVPYQRITPNTPETLNPIYSQHDKTLLTHLNQITPQNGTMQIEKFGITQYNAATYAQLPIYVLSLTPFKARINTNEADTYLNVFKLYLPGYQAKVNGAIVAVLETKNHQIMIPLLLEGPNQIELTYIGTKLMQTTFYISSIAWFILIIYFIFMEYLYLKSSRIQRKRYLGN